MTPTEREQTARRMIKQYQELRKAVAEAEEEIDGKQLVSTLGSEPVRTSHVSDPTARCAFADIKIDKARLWVSAIDAAVAELDESAPETAEILRRHFRMRYTSGWKHTHAAKTRETMCEIYHISRREYYRRVDAGVAEVVFQAGIYKLFF